MREEYFVKWENRDSLKNLTKCQINKMPTRINLDNMPSRDWIYSMVFCPNNILILRIKKDVATNVEKMLRKAIEAMWNV